MAEPQDLPLVMQPIGVIHSHMRLKFDAPPQPDAKCSRESVVELYPHRGFDQALRDLAGFDRIWLIWWFHRNSTWRPVVLPPRGAGKKRGVFATRSPHRPNPIAISAVPLLGISGRKLFVGSNDLIDGTPILDIKPYLSSVDSFPTAANGWLAEVEAEFSGPARFTVQLSAQAQLQIDWLAERGVDLLPRAREILERTPYPHRTRRIMRTAADELRMGCGAWRLYFSIAGQEVLIDRVTPGYPHAALRSSRYDRIPFREEQLIFGERWPDPPRA